MHGGTQPVGPASPSWKHGRRSKALPQRLLGDYYAARDDPERLALSEEIGVIDARMNDVLARVDSGESGRLWAQLREMAREYESAKAARDAAGVASWMNQIIDVIKRGNADWAAWESVMGLIERRRKLVDSEGKRLVAAQQMIHVEQAMALLALLVEAVRLHANDDTLRAVTAEYARLTGVPRPLEAPAVFDVTSRRRGSASDG